MGASAAGGVVCGRIGGGFGGAGLEVRAGLAFGRAAPAGGLDQYGTAYGGGFAGDIRLQRELATAKVGDLLVVHDTGAYGASMSSNYNTRPLIAEVLVENGQARLIRRRQTVAELLAELERRS